MPPSRCQGYVQLAVDYICMLMVQQDVALCRALAHDPALGALEQAVNVAVLDGDARATKAACRAWWAAWRQAIKQAHHTTTEAFSHV